MIDNKYFNDFPILESDRLLFRKIEISDAREIFKIRSNDQVLLFMDSDKHLTVKDSEVFINYGVDSYSKQEGMFWAIIEKSSQEFIGDFAFWKIDQRHHRAEVGYTLSPNYWRKGFMKETMSTILKFGFDKMNIHSFEANINPKNNNSKQLLLSKGFKKEAYFKENYFHNGSYLDSEIYSLLVKDLIT